jgi:hypothetical protein
MNPVTSPPMRILHDGLLLLVLLWRVVLKDSAKGAQTAGSFKTSRVIPISRCNPSPRRSLRTNHTFARKALSRALACAPAKPFCRSGSERAGERAREPE